MADAGSDFVEAYEASLRPVGRRAQWIFWAALAEHASKTGNAKLLGDLGSRQHSEILVEHLLSDPDPVARQRAAEALERLGGDVAASGLAQGLGMDPERLPENGSDPEADGAALAQALAQGARERYGSTHALAVLGRLDGPPRGRAGHMSAALHFALATPDGMVTRQANLTGNRDWIGKGAAEMGLDVIRRHLQELPVEEKIDFEKK